ncbi:MAG: ATP-binding protein [Coriobacteriia bacterium]|nr:ATP-binding protein [Coriobacteriia bacterium]
MDGTAAYISRHIENAVKEAARTFPAVVVTGPRQVGKTTMLRELFPQAPYMTLDRLDALEAARREPERFISLLDASGRSTGGPVVIDEVQYAPDLFRYTKIAIDAQRHEKGRFMFTGSQRFQMMQGIDESMAGCVGIIEMLGLSLREILRSTATEPFMPTEEYFLKRGHLGTPQQEHAGLPTASPTNQPTPLPASLTAYPDIWEMAFRGDLPELYADTSMDSNTFYGSYIETYLKRDVRDLAHVGDLTSFNRFMSLTALLHGQQLNKASLAAMAGLTAVTVTRWLSVLEALGIIYLLKPFLANTGKRLTKTPKLYFLNSGLAARLCGFETAGELERSSQAGAFFEGLVITEILKSHLNATGRLPDVYYYREHGGSEIDLILCKGTNLYPIEIKKSTMARTGDTDAFKHLDSFTGFKRQAGAVICNCPDLLPLGDDSWACPVYWI